jgi:hypothetical protein
MRLESLLRWASGVAEGKHHKLGATKSLCASKFASTIHHFRIFVRCIDLRVTDICFICCILSIIFRMGSPERKDLLRPLQSKPKTPGKKEPRERVGDMLMT